MVISAGDLVKSDRCGVVALPTQPTRPQELVDESQSVAELGFIFLAADILIYPVIVTHSKPRSKTPQVVGKDDYTTTQRLRDQRHLCPPILLPFKHWTIKCQYYRASLPILSIYTLVCMSETRL